MKYKKVTAIFYFYFESELRGILKIEAANAPYIEKLREFQDEPS